VVGPQRARPNVGGPGLRRGRRDAAFLGVGDPVDFWQVEDVSPAPRLRLHAELRLPGDAWLTWELFADRAGTRVVQAAESPGQGPFSAAPTGCRQPPFTALIFQGSWQAQSVILNPAVRPDGFKWGRCRWSRAAI
jgi:hypothetical protein